MLITTSIWSITTLWRTIPNRLLLERRMSLSFGHKMVNQREIKRIAMISLRQKILWNCHIVCNNSCLMISNWLKMQQLPFWSISYSNNNIWTSGIQSINNIWLITIIWLLTSEISRRGTSTKFRVILKPKRMLQTMLQHHQSATMPMQG